MFSPAMGPIYPMPPPEPGGRASVVGVPGGAVAKRLKTARAITITGAMNGSEKFDGSKDIEINVTANVITHEDIDSMFMGE